MLIIYYAKKDLNKEEIIEKLSIKLKYQKFSFFNYKCCDTIDNCLYALFTSKNFQEIIKKVILYGVDDKLIEAVKEKLPINFKYILNKGYQNNKL